MAGGLGTAGQSLGAPVAAGVRPSPAEPARAGDPVGDVGVPVPRYRRCRVTSREAAGNAIRRGIKNHFMAVGHRDQVMNRKGLLLVGHGSKLPYNKELVEETARLIGSRRPEFVVRCGFMSMNTPSVEDALADFRKDDVDAIVVVPLFLAKGVHINRDIPQILGLPEGSCRGSFQKNHASIPLVYADPIGTDPLLADLMLKNAERAIRDHL